MPMLRVIGPFLVLWFLCGLSNIILDTLRKDYYQAHMDLIKLAFSQFSKILIGYKDGSLIIEKRTAKKV